MSHAKRAGVAAITLAAMAWQSAARADATSDACVDANTSGQSLRLDGKLSAAREQLRACNDARCPAIVREDCAARLEELDRAQPTLAFDAQGAAGSDVTVAIDGGAPVALTGAEIAVDPGEHVFVFEAQGRRPVTLRLGVRLGEKGRRERVVLLEEAPPATSVSTTTIPEGSNGRRTFGIVAGSIGLAALGVGTIFGLKTISAADDQNAHCASATNCIDHARALADHDDAKTSGAISTVAFVAGAALLVTGAVLIFTGGSAKGKP